MVLGMSTFYEEASLSKGEAFHREPVGIARTTFTQSGVVRKGAGWGAALVLRCRRAARTLR